MRKAAKEVKTHVASAVCEEPGVFTPTPATTAPPFEAAGARSPADTAVWPSNSNATRSEIEGGVRR